MKKILMVLFVIIGTIIGAGFASGKEIYIFFFRYGFNGNMGLIVTAIFISATIYMVFKIINYNKINSYEEFLTYLFKDNRKLYSKISKLFCVLINMFLLISYNIMIAGFGAFLSQELKINKILGATIISVGCYIALKKDKEGVLKVNTILIPMLIISIIVVGIINIPAKIPVNYRNRQLIIR